jgi:hypothetical protein
MFAEYPRQRIPDVLRLPPADAGVEDHWIVAVPLGHHLLEHVVPDGLRLDGCPQDDPVVVPALGVERVQPDAADRERLLRRDGDAQPTLLRGGRELHLPESVAPLTDMLPRRTLYPSAVCSVRGVLGYLCPVAPGGSRRLEGEERSRFGRRKLNRDSHGLRPSFDAAIPLRLQRLKQAAVRVGGGRQGHETPVPERGEFVAVLRDVTGSRRCSCDAIVPGRLAPSARGEKSNKQH